MYTNILPNLILKTSKSQVQRLFSNTTMSTRLVYSEYGTPSKVIQKEINDIVEPKGNQVLLKMLASPVNPVDINVIEGKYVSIPKLPAIAGSEGIGEVISVGSAVSEFKQGDRAVILKMDIGTWRNHITVSQDAVLKVPRELGLVQGATLAINPCTAYRMLTDYADLKPGDVVIQNGSNSACGQNIIQLARSWGIHTVNIIRSRPNIDELKNFLTSLGATYVLTDEELKSTELFKSKQIPQAKLALDCVGGKSAAALLRNLQSGANMVVYGGMSKQPVIVPVPALIFNDNRICGFRIAQWMGNNERNEKWYKMFDELITLMLKGDLKGPVHKFVDVDNYREALDNTITQQGMIGKKFILSFDSSTSLRNKL